MTDSDTRGVGKESEASGETWRRIFGLTSARYGNSQQSTSKSQGPALRPKLSISQGSKHIIKDHVLLALLYSPPLSTIESVSYVRYLPHLPIDENVALTTFADSSSLSSF